jgi:hypothetical protein
MRRCRSSVRPFKRSLARGDGVKNFLHLAEFSQGFKRTGGLVRINDGHGEADVNQHPGPDKVMQWLLRHAGNRYLSAHAGDLREGELATFIRDGKDATWNT